MFLPDKFPHATVNLKTRVDTCRSVFHRCQHQNLPNCITWRKIPWSITENSVGQTRTLHCNSKFKILRWILKILSWKSVSFNKILKLLHSFLYKKNGDSVKKKYPTLKKQTESFQACQKVFRSGLFLSRLEQHELKVWILHSQNFANKPGELLHNKRIVGGVKSVPIWIQ